MSNKLRNLAEALLATNPDATPTLATADVQSLVHELQIHQVELEMQNEEMRQSQLELAASRDAYEELYDASPLSYLTVNQDGRILKVNRAAASMLGIDGPSLNRGMKISDFIQPDSQDAYHLHRTALMQGEMDHQVELNCCRQDGTPFIGHLHCTVVQNSSPENWRCLAALIDITEQKETREQLENLNLYLEQRVNVRTEELATSEAVLVRQREDLRRLASELSMAEQSERKRIAIELHDELGQLLSNCYMQLDVLRKDPEFDQKASILDSVCETLNLAIRGARSLTFDLSIPVLYELGLIPALEELCQEVSRKHGMAIRCEHDNPSQPLADECRMVLYRGVRELLNNVLKHAEARHVHVQVNSNPEGVRIQVEDDGKGFDAAHAGEGFSPTGGFGLFNIQEHLWHIGGQMVIKSKPGQGTRVFMEAPLAPKKS